TYSWNTGATTSAITVTPASTTSYTVTVGNGTCSVKDSVTVTVNAVPVPTITPPATICSGQSTVITAGGGTTYSWSPATGLSATTGASVTASPLVTTSYTVTVSNGSCSKDTNVKITVNPSPTITVAPTSATICNGSNVNLTASGGVTYTWSPATGLSATTGGNVTATPGSTTTYTITGTGSVGGCTGKDSVTVTVDAVPVPTITGPTSDCKGSPITLTAGGGSGFVWSTGATTSTITVSPVANTGYTVTVSNGPCSAKDSTTITVNTPPAVTACCDTSINIGGSASIKATATGVTYNWFPASNLSCTVCPNPSASPTVTTVYYVTVTDANGCTSTDSVIVTVFEDCHDPFVPTAFSPNGDGSNDMLMVYGNCIKALEFAVYDRWGNKVFETTD